MFDQYDIQAQLSQKNVTITASLNKYIFYDPNVKKNTKHNFCQVCPEFNTQL